MSERLIAYFNEHPFIPEIDFRSSFHYAYLKELLAVFKKTELTQILDKLFNKKINKRERDKILQTFYLELGILCETHRPNNKIISLCGAHIDTLASISNLKSMLKSWSEQDYKVGMILSLSWNTEIDITQLVEDLAKYPDLMLELNHKFTTPFEHYSHIVGKYYSSHFDYQIIFTRDTDLWSTRRSMVYALSTIFCDAIKMKHDFIVYPYLSKDMTKPLSGYGEYTSYSIKFDLFKKFIVECNPMLLQNKYCDKYLIKYLNNVSKWFSTKLPLVGWAKQTAGNNLPESTLGIPDLVSIYYSAVNTSPVEFLSNQFKSHDDLSTDQRNDITMSFLQALSSYDYLKNSPIHMSS